MAKAVKAEVKYRADEDILVVQFSPAAPAITLEMGDGALARIDPDSQQLIAYEILNWAERMEESAAKPTAQPGGHNGAAHRKPAAFLPRGLQPA